MNGVELTRLRQGNLQVPVVARLRMEERAGLGDLRRASTSTPPRTASRKCRWARCPTSSPACALEKVHRRNQFRTITVSDLPAGRLAAVRGARRGPAAPAPAREGAAARLPFRGRRRAGEAGRRFPRAGLRDAGVGGGDLPGAGAAVPKRGQAAAGLRRHPLRHGRRLFLARGSWTCPSASWPSSASPA